MAASGKKACRSARPFYDYKESGVGYERFNDSHFHVHDGGLGEPAFLATLGMDKEEMTAWIRRSHLRALADELQDAAMKMGVSCRHSPGGSAAVLGLPSPGTARRLAEMLLPAVLVRLFPGSCQGNRELEAAVGRGAQGDIYRQGCLIFMQLLRGLYHYERNVLPFDPKKDMPLIPAEEIARKGYIKEYLRLRMLATDDYIYEFMRIGIDITPFNTLGHVGGVHYVAVYAARQLARNGIPVDVPHFRRRRLP